jgi:hypothetical protein
MPGSRNDPLLDNGSNIDSRCNEYAGESQSVVTDWHTFPWQRILTKTQILVATDNTE